MDNLDGGTVAVSYFGDMDLINPAVVSPDAGGVYRAKQFREALAKKHDVDCGLAMIVKQRVKPGEIGEMNLVDSVEGCDVPNLYFTSLFIFCIGLIPSCVAFKTTRFETQQHKKKGRFPRNLIILL